MNMSALALSYVEDLDLSEAQAEIRRFAQDLASKEQEMNRLGDQFVMHC